jgi:hypothetical protein
MSDADVDFFTRPTTQKKPAKNYENIVTDEILDRLKSVESSGDTYALNPKTKAGGAYQFTPEQTITMHKKGIVFNPLVEKEARQAARTYLQQLVNQNEGDIKKALAQYGGFVKADPTEYVNKVMGVTTPKSPTAQLAQTSAPVADEDVSFFQRVAPPPAQPTPEEQIGNQAAFGIYPRVSGRREIIKQAKPPSLEGMGGSLAAIGDVVAGAPSALLGLAGYGGLRLAGRTPEQAQETAQSTAGLIAQPIGKLTGTVGTPAYEQDVLTTPLRQLGQFTQQKAKDISARTGIPEQDVEFGLNAGMLAAPKLIKTVAPPIGRALGGAGETVNDVRAQMAQQFAAKQGQPQPTTQPPQQGMQSGGAMAAMPETVLRANIDSALANASPELQAQVKNINPQKVNIPALETRTLEEKHGVNLLTSQRTNDLLGYTDAWNNRTKNGLISDFEQQPKQLANAFEQSKRRNAPDISSEADASELGQITINSLAQKDLARQQAISKAYKALEDANGGQFPIDTGKLKQNIDAELLQKYKSRYLSEGISGDLKQFVDNPTFEGFEALRTNLADEMRSAKDGKTRQAAYIVREQLEKLPIFGEEGGSPQAKQLKGLADNARKLYAERQKIIANNPAYKAAVKEASSLDDVVSQGESLNADKFHKKFVSSASPEAIRRLKSELSPDDLANQAITFSELERTKRAITNANESRVKSDTFADFVKKNKSVLREALPPEAMQDVMEIGLLNSKIGKPEAGGFNYSNSYTALIRDLAKQGLLTLGETKLATATGGMSIAPVAGVKGLLQKLDKDAFVNNQRNAFGGLTKD